MPSPSSSFLTIKNVVLFRDSRLIEPTYVLNFDIRLVLILTLLWRFIKTLDSPTSQPHQDEQLKFKPIQYLEFEKYKFPPLHTNCNVYRSTGSRIFPLRSDVEQPQGQLFCNCVICTRHLERTMVLNDFIHPFNVSCYRRYMQYF